MPDLLPRGELQQVVRTTHVDVLIKQRFLDRRAHASHRREMHNRIECNIAHTVENIAVPKIGLDQTPARMPAVLRDIAFFDVAAV